jgi:hypothetical protein
MMQVIDPTTRSGFLEIASAAGRERAHECRIAAYEHLAERDGHFRWHGVKWQRALSRAQFELAYERANPQACELLRANGIGY